MKKPLFFLLALVISFTTIAQEDIYRTLAIETCECISKRKMDMTKRKEVEMALGLCMLESAQRNNMDLEMTDSEAMRKLGEKVGIQMAPICPDVFSAFIEQGKDETDVLSLSGKIKSVEEKDFLFITLKENGGKEHKLIWLRYFPGSDEFQEDPKKLVGKHVSITYQEIECYLPKAKLYYNNKEITSLQIDE